MDRESQLKIISLTSTGDQLLCSHILIRNLLNRKDIYGTWLLLYFSISVSVSLYLSLSFTLSIILSLVHSLLHSPSYSVSLLHFHILSILSESLSRSEFLSLSHSFWIPYTLCFFVSLFPSLLFLINTISSSFFCISVIHSQLSSFFSFPADSFSPHFFFLSVPKSFSFSPDLSPLSIFLCCLLFSLLFLPVSLSLSPSCSLSLSFSSLILSPLLSSISSPLCFYNLHSHCLLFLSFSFSLNIRKCFTGNLKFS